MNPARLLAALALLVTGLGTCGTALYLLATAAAWNVQSRRGMACLALLVTSLLVICFAGSLWRSGGGGHVGHRRRR